MRSAISDNVIKLGSSAPPLAQVPRVFFKATIFFFLMRESAVNPTKISLLHGVVSRAVSQFPLDLIQIPHFHGIVKRAGSQPPISQYRDCTHPAGMPFQRPHACCSVGLFRSHTFTVLSLELEASRPSANAATDNTAPSCPFRVATHCCSAGLLRSHTFTVLS